MGSVKRAEQLQGIPRTKSWPSLGNVKGGKVYESLEKYVKAKGGKRVIRRILIANNGIAAVKGIRSMQKWAYETFGDEKILHFICMATPDDIKVNAEYIHMANEVVNVPGGSNNNNYANVSLIIDIAQRLKADAVWAGWGHASENPRLPDGLSAHNAGSKQQIVWIGPPASAMRALGDKIGSTLIAQTAGVSCIGWSGERLTVDLSQGGAIPSDIYDQACVHDWKEAVAVCQKIGFPVMIKASEGGGGKGIRMCHTEGEVKERFGQVIGEVPGSPVFIMKLAPTCRHLEVQLLGDEWGNAIAIHGRDCSIQRRHQKIIEEGPVVAAKTKIWRAMEQAAVRLAKAVGYVGAGTVEYLYTQDHKYYFLELNPRLQVEHPVTELISGVNLPAAQLQVAMGLPLASIPHIRRFYGKPVEQTDDIDFDRSLPVTQPMHVIACRITAENPEMEFQPTSGTIHHLNFRSTPQVWGYFSVSSNGGVHQFADSQFGHLFATGKTREESRRNMVQALKELTIQGEIRTTVEYLGRILETKDFVENQVSTNWLEGIMRSNIISDKGKLQEPVVVTLGALFRAWRGSRAAQTNYMDCLERGQIPPMTDLQAIIETNVDLIYQSVKYKTVVTCSGPRHFDVQLRLEDWTASVEVHELADKGLLAMMDGKRYIVYGREQPDGLRLSIDSKTYMFSREYDPTRLIAEMQGKLVRYTVEDGGHVRKNKAFAEMEVMKMYIALVAPEDGKLTHCKPEGAVLEGGDLIARLELDDSSNVQTAKLFDGKFPEMGPPLPIGQKPNVLLEDALMRLKRLLSGYKLGKGLCQEAVKMMMGTLRDPLLPCYQFNSIISTIAAKLPAKLVGSLTSINTRYKKSLSSHRFHWEKHEQFPAPEMLEVIQTTMALEKNSDTVGPLVAVLQPLSEFLSLYADGNHTYAVHVITELLEQYYTVESHFTGAPELVIKDLRRHQGYATELVAEFARGHYQVHDRTALVMDLFAIMCANLRPLLREFDPILRKLAALEGPEQTKVAIQARKVMMEGREPTFEERRMEMEAILKTALYAKAFADRSRILEPLVTRPGGTENLLLVDCMSHRATNVRRMAMEAYILRNHSDYAADDVKISTEYGFLLARFRSAKLQNKGGLYEDICRSKGGGGGSSMGRSVAGASSAGCGSPMRVTATVAFFSDQEQMKGALKLLFPFASSTPSSPKSSPTRPKPKSSAGDAAMEEEENAEDGGAVISTAKTVYLILKSDVKDDDKASEDARLFLAKNQSSLLSAGIVRVTLVVAFRGMKERLFTFRAADGFKEDTLIRHLRPLLAAHIDLRRMKHFSVSLAHSDGSTKILEATPINARPGRDGYDGRRLFVRRVVQHFSRSHLINDSHVIGNNNTAAQAEAPVASSPRADNSSVDDDKPSLEGGGEGGEDEKKTTPATATTAARPVAATDGEASFLSLIAALEIGCGNDMARYRNNNLGMLLPVPLRGVSRKEVARHVQLLVERHSKRIFRQLAVQAVEFSCALLLDNDEDGDRLDGKQNSTSATSSDGEKTTKLLVVATNPSGYRVSIHSYVQDDHGKYREVDRDRGSGATSIGPLDGQPIDTPYPVTLPYERQRQAARRVGTVYCYDYLTLFEEALQDMWATQQPNDTPPPTELLVAKELVLVPKKAKRGTSASNDEKKSHQLLTNGRVESTGVGAENWELAETTRDIGKNDIAMVAWHLTLRTPLHPNGRELILISNDISVAAGSFGVLEDVLFDLASKRARALGLPRFYFAVNSGARIGLAKEVMYKFRVAWNQGDVTKGPAYLYLSDTDYQLLKDSVVAERVEEEVVANKEEEKKKTSSAAADATTKKQQCRRWKILDIIGKQNGLGVENLSGSGLIAGETSVAYNEIFTLTYCSGRSVGIGAYLARLGQRVVQRKMGAPILLTGHFALNKLLGKRVYTSNDQLGGIDVMYANGVTHLTCEDDLDGVKQCLRWLSYVPRVRHDARAVLDDSVRKLMQRGSQEQQQQLPRGKGGGDEIDRAIQFVPPSGPYDTRCLMEGLEVKATSSSSSKDGDAKQPSSSSSSTSWLSGFFDKGSFMELMEGWAKTVICGRARLGGMPVGVIAVTTKMVEEVLPADPAMPDSKEIVSVKAGQVWYPDSAFKTAQAIRDMNSEDLPLIIFANWRGFSGGMRDMFDQVLKFGSYIVDALVAYEQPISVYLPPHATLRGGAWVVVDSLINPYFMQMYADPRARGGILEVEATCGIKFRRKDELLTAYRLDNTLQSLKSKLESHTNKNNSKGDSSKSEVDAKQQLPPRHISAANGAAGSTTVAERPVAGKQELLQEIRDREQKVLPSFHQAAAMFVDLHDTPGRMKAKGIINEIVPWESSRKYFYWNIRRRCQMARLAKLVKEALPSLDFFNAEKRVKELLASTELSKVWSDDEKVFAILRDNESIIKAAVPHLRAEHLAAKARTFFNEQHKGDSVEGVGKFLSGLKLDKDAATRLKKWVNANM